MVNSNNIEKILYMGVGRSGLDNEASIIAKALSELMEYRAIGTIEEIQSMKDNGAFSGIELAQLAAMQMKLKDYQEIGTVKELKALKEKSVAKKVISRNSIYRCPTCESLVSVTQTKCTKCSQKLNWQ